jgi:excisionase family DNA binding protein
MTPQTEQGDAAPLRVPSPWMTSSEAAAYISGGVKPRTVIKWTREGKLKGYPIGGGTGQRHRWRFRQCDLDKFLGVTDTGDDDVLESSTSSVVVQ